jgi:hypothetical protein
MEFCKLRNMPQVYNAEVDAPLRKELNTGLEGADK